MHANLGSTLLVVGLLTLSFGSALAIVPRDESIPSVDLAVAEIVLPSTVQRVGGPRPQGLSASAAWQSFETRHGRWSAWWNESTGTPHRAGGPGISLEGFEGDSASVDAAVRSFVDDHADLFRRPVLETVAIQHVGRVWYARYRQRIEGMPVIGADWEFRVGDHGRLFLFGADAHDAQSVSSRAVGRGREAARAAAVQEISFDPATDRIEGGERKLLLPVPAGSGVELRPVYDLRVRTHSPRGYWLVRVDAVSGTVIERRDLARRAIDGHVTGDVHSVLPQDPLVPRTLPHLWVAVGPESAATDLDGHYAAAANSGAISAGLYGRYIDVRRLDGPNASIAMSAPGPGTYDLSWNVANSDVSERDVYHHVMVAYDDMKRIDPGLVRLDRPVVTTVNEPSNCNAYWDGHGMGFLAAGGGCVSTATVSSIVHHEYGHGVAYERYRQAANDTLVVPVNGMLSEGMAELNSILLGDEPVQGRGMRGPGTHLRTNGLVNRWPDDVSANEYNTMFIFTGAFWDLRLEVGKAVAEHLFHFAMYGLPEDPDDGVALTEYFLETLVVDDDDADLSNGTPHLDAILRAFNARGLGTRSFFTFSHTPLADSAAVMGGPQVTATIAYSGPIGALDSASPELVYSINSGPWGSVPMSTTGLPNQYRAAIPAPDESVVRYYLKARDSFGGIATLPVGAPDNRPYTFLYGSPTVRFADDMEIDRGWSAVAEGDDAAANGRWVRLDPNSTSQIGDVVQTGDDHTADGTICWVTGDAAPGNHSNFADVDNGRTSLTSPTLDASDLGNPVIEYYRWYFNRGVIEPDTDPLRVYLSNDDGANWVVVENTTHTENRWVRIVLRIQDYLAPTSQMKVRFVAQDSISNSTVEAAVDDFRLLGLPPSVATPNVALPARLELANVSPNPAARGGRIECVLPRAGHARLAVVDVGGRAVATLFDGLQAAGRQTVSWSARQVPPGLYFVVLEADGERRVRRITVLR
jgi:hypothetical protein